MKWSTIIALERGPLHAKALPPFASLRAFEAVGRSGGIRKAAASLGLDHAVVSRHIKMIEDWFGVPLFQRTGGRLYLTEAGQDYHGRVSAALMELASATHELQQTRRDGPLQLWCVPGFAAQWLTHRVAEFEDIFPSDRVEVRPTDATADLLMLEADMDIRFYGDGWPPRPGGKGLRFVELARPPIMAVASPKFVAGLNKIESAADLAALPLLHEEHDRQWASWLRLNGVPMDGPIAGPLLWHAHLAIAAARAGRGIALASNYLVEQDLADGTLVELKFPGNRRAVIGSYMLVTREDRWDYPVVRRFRRFLQAKVRERG
ncbi:LysR family transcriptional regulator [Sphingopyxis sp. Root214]|uniref:LysR substrate-binding domain-containing protein n=1 Tax=unclassified Sphingopyxis TaxID=2614943 RepID=UPI0006F8DDDF|nr:MULTISPECIES: LysR substrate-binding domain-containing protein [unclassified Sphingopyxis]KQZ76782.1 LysR family transcriptional regulator [Sphingopyxis sp. Root154]KRC09331.1 LysR family transcriptional regulator [Sphingopyxis sp. Root214]